MTDTDAATEALQRRFAHIAQTAMAGLPMVHPGLSVQALGFAPEEVARPPGGAPAQDPDAAAWASGVLITPWFMNWVRLPLNAEARRDNAAVGVRVVRPAGPNQTVDCLGSLDEELGPFEACSLFSPMHGFEDHAAALSTAEHVLALMRPATPTAPPAATVPSRRAFLMGRAA